MKFKSIFLMIFICLFSFTLISCDSFINSPQQNEFVFSIKNSETNVELSGNVILELGEEIRLTFNKELWNVDVDFNFSNEEVAKVEEKVLKATKVGKTKVNASVLYEGKTYTATFNIEVVSFELSLKGNVRTLAVGDVVALEYKVEGTTITPTFRSADSDVLLVVGSAVKGVATGYTKLIGELELSSRVLRKEVNIEVTEEAQPEMHVVTFKDYNFNILKEELVADGSAATAPDVPERLGYEFKGWNKSFSKVTTNLTVVAQYQVIEYRVTFIKNSQSEEIVMPNDTTYTVEKALTLPTPQAPFRFMGWYDNPECLGDVITSIPKGSIEERVFYAKWDENDLKFYTITYEYEEGKPEEHVCSDIPEFAEQFFKELYAWSGSTSSLADFKAACLEQWKKGNEYKQAKIYCNGSENQVLEGYFVSSEDNFNRWMPWMMEFDRQVNDINHDQHAWSSTYVGYLRLYSLLTESASYWNATRKQALYSLITVPAVLPTTYEAGDEFDIPELFVEDGRTFLGWVDANNQVISKVTSNMKTNLVLYATWSNSTPIESFELVKPERIEKYDTYQLSWTFNPQNTTNKRLNFISSDPSVLAISNKGLITTYKEGVVRVTVEVLANEALNQVFDVEVYVNPFIDGKYTTSSILRVNETESLQITKYNFDDSVVWTSSNDSVASVVDGFVTAVSKGFTTITVKSSQDENVKFEFGITVTDGDEDFTIIEEAHNDDSFIRRDLNVAYAYLTDVTISASDLLFNYDYQINRDYESVQAQHSENHSGTRPSTEFITVHYTAGYQKSSTAKATASYFANGGSQSSIHYTTGNDGIYHILDDSLIGWHAGDGTGVAFKWIYTGVKATENVKPIWGVERNSNSSTGYYFTLNGQSTTIEVITTGTTSSGATKTMADPSKCFTYFGPAWKVENGYYYMGNTWACFTQTLAGAISSRGGNRNSVGIESACNQGSDLWLTYQITAQLVAHLLQTYNLDYSRVVGHNAFSGKDCPQTLLANGGELWELFMECVIKEHQLLTTMSDYTITCKSNNPELLEDNGRILSIPKYSTSASYTVTVRNNTTGETKTETFSTIIHGWYTE